MKIQRSLRMLPILLIALLMMTCSFSVSAQETENEQSAGLTKDVVVLYTSDIHCGVKQGFGFVGLQAVKESMEAAGNYVLLVDDGDAIQGETLGMVSRGEAIINLMNAMKYDVAIPGNHEFDYGMDRFLELTGLADFPYISCNFEQNGELVFEPYVMKEFDGVQIAFVGVTTPETLTSCSPKNFKDEAGNYIYGFCQDETGEKLYEAVQSAVDDARAEGADYVIVLAHLGNSAESEPWNYADVISNTTGIDAVLDGHSHDTDQVIMQNRDGEDVIRSACGTKMGGIGWLRIPADPEKKPEAGLYTWRNDVPAPELFGITNGMTQEIEKAEEVLGEQLEEVVAKSPVDLIINDPDAVNSEGLPIRIVRRAETNLGDLCADAFRDQSGADVALVNSGGIREKISAGDITMGDILSVFPFGNGLCVVEVTGQQILDALEWGARALPSENSVFMQVSGLTYEIHTYIESSCIADKNSVFQGVDGEYRVKNVMVGDEPLDLEKTYTLASQNFLLKEEGDGCSMFRNATLLQDEVKLDSQLLIDYLAETLGGTVGEEYADPYGQGRIVAVEEPPAEETEEEAATEGALEETVTEGAQEEAVTEDASEAVMTP